MVVEAPAPDLARTPIPDGHPLLRRLLALQIPDPGAWDELSAEEKTQLYAATDDEEILTGLLGMGLITPFQYGRIRGGELHQLVLGNYRVLDRIGSGGMGVVFRAQHCRLRQPVAIKAMFLTTEPNRRALDRFFREVQAVTKLRHPNIVAALDAGEQPGAGLQGAPVPYLVMEYVEGVNLEDLIERNGPLPVDRACAIAYQMADALAEAHRFSVIHRDVKPGNVIVAADGSAKLLDFGVARLSGNDDRLTKLGTQLGTIGYMAPEQVRNAREVDARADMFGLGASLFFMLTGRSPFGPPAGATGAERPPSARALRAEVSPALDDLLGRFMHLDAAGRTPTAQAAMNELLPFAGIAAEHDARTAPSDRSVNEALAAGRNAPAADTQPAASYRILVVDDQPDIRRVCKIALATEGAKVEEAGTGPEAIDRLEADDYDLVLLDVDLPGCSGEQVLKKLRTFARQPYQKVIMFSGRTSGDELSRFLPQGADDFLTKPFSLVQLRARVKSALRMKDVQDRSELLNRHLMTLTAELEKNVSHRDGELLHARGAMVLALAKLVEQRSSETGPHLVRLQKFCRVLADAAQHTPAFAQRLDAAFIQTLEDSAPLHDIGKVAVPDSILNKPDRLSDDERRQMQYHTIAGADTLREVARRYSFATGFLQMAIDIARSHHERWDGTGYPDQLAGEAIPLAARILAICDVYDALRSKRVYKPAISHNMTVLTICDGSPGHFDPGLLAVFRQCAQKFERIYSEFVD